MSLPTEFRKKAGGFTLMEMMITLAIFVMLSAAVFEIITGVLQSASALQDNQNRRDQLVALHDYLNRQWRGLPAKGVLISYRRGDGDGLKQNGVIFGEGQQLTALDAVLQANGYYTLRLTAFDPSAAPNVVASPVLIFEAALTRADPGLVWTPLIHDVRHVEWKFQILNMTEWEEMWSDQNSKPNLVEFTMEQAGDLRPATMDFWIPRIDPANTATVP